MARITVEDCLAQIPNRFQLVLAATYRARMLSQGHAPKIESKNKPGVTVSTVKLSPSRSESFTFTSMSVALSSLIAETSFVW